MPSSTSAFSLFHSGSPDLMSSAATCLPGIVEQRLVIHADGPAVDIFGLGMAPAALCRSSSRWRPASARSPIGTACWGHTSCPARSRASPGLADAFEGFVERIGLAKHRVQHAVLQRHPLPRRAILRHFIRRDEFPSALRRSWRRSTLQDSLSARYRASGVAIMVLRWIMKPGTRSRVHRSVPL